MSHSAASVQAGDTASVTYTITNPNTITTAANVRFDHDFAAFAPGITVPTLPSGGFCGAGSTAARTSTPGFPDSFIEFRNMSLGQGQSCSFSVDYAVPGTFRNASLEQRTGALSADILGATQQSAARSSTINVTDLLPAEPASLSMQLVPASLPAGAARSIRYTISLPAGGRSVDRIEFEHDVAFFSTGVTIDAAIVPATPCGAGSSFVSYGTASQYQLLGGQINPGGSCTFDVPILTAGVAAGSFEQRTGALRTVIGANTFTSSAASAMMEVTGTVTTPPVITVSNVRKALDAGAATASVILNATATDESGDPVAVTYQLNGNAITSPHAFPEGASTVTVRAEDNSGNVATDTFTVTTFPNQPLDLTGQFIGGPLLPGQSASYQVTLRNPNGVAVTADPAIAGFGDANNQPTIGVLPNNVTASVSAISGAGCSGSLTQFPAPVSGGAGGTVDLAAGASCSITITLTAGSNPEVGTFATFASAEFDNIGGNFSSGGALSPVIVATSDTTPPVISASADLTANTDAGEPFARLDVTGLGSVTDNSGSVPTITYSVGATVLSGPFDFPIGATTVTMDASDTSGNAATQASFMVTISDIEAPVISANAPAPVRAALGASSASAAFTASASDNSGDPVTLVFELANGTQITSPHDFAVGTTTVTVRAIDSAGNEATEDFDVVVTDGSSPTIALSADTTNLRAGQTATVTFDLNKDTTDFEETDVAVTGGTLSDFSGSGQSYSATFSPDASSTTEGRLSVASGSFTDAVGNANADGADADNTLVIAIDTVLPSATISALSGPDSGAFTASITLSEPSTDFDADDLVLVNADAVLAGSGDTYRVTLTPRGNGLVSVAIAANSFSDGAGNSNDAASNTESAIFDGTLLTVEITGLPDTFIAQTALTATITFSEAVSGFEIADLIFGNATAIVLAGSGASYTARIRPTGRGDVTLQVPANAARNAAGRGNIASTSARVRNETVGQTQRQIAQFMASRANQLVASQPGLACHLRQSCSGGSAEANVTRGHLSFNLNSRPNWPVWFQLNGTRTNESSTSSDYLFGAFGAHREINDNTLVGLLFEFDHVRQSSGTSNIEGTGWLVGPYFVTRLPNQPLYLEGRLLAGMSHNRIQPFGTYKDKFETKRLLAQLKVSGQLEYGETTLIPSLAGSYVADTQLAYTDSLGNHIAEQGIELGQLELGLDFETPAAILGQLWTLGGGVSAIYSTTSGSGAAQSVVTNYNGGRARLELSGSTIFSNGAYLNLGASYDGIGASGFEAVGFELGFQWEF
ncbi:Ig-like domain-containing protein [Phaeobacter sp. C3_T13_0]|uniref:Ig-like domain-containing protein n=1 Tax=Phaeobacter cretensis TaxID=3342641 RepID=UPI0039BD2C08